MNFLSTKTLAFLALFLFFSTLSSHSQSGQVEINQDPQIDELLILKKEINTTQSTDGKYTIQIYSGNRQGAEKSKTEFLNKFSEWKTSLVYEEPNYKIWVGHFKTRLEADRALVDLQGQFPNAFIFKPKTRS